MAVQNAIIAFFTAINHNNIKITSNKLWNTEKHKTDPNPPITNQKEIYLLNLLK